MLWKVDAFGDSILAHGEVPTECGSVKHPQATANKQASKSSVSGLMVKSIVAIDGLRVRFAADALPDLY